MSTLSIKNLNTIDTRAATLTRNKTLEAYSRNGPLCVSHCQRVALLMRKEDTREGFGLAAVAVRRGVSAVSVMSLLRLVPRLWTGCCFRAAGNTVRSRAVDLPRESRTGVANILDDDTRASLSSTKTVFPSDRRFRSAGCQRALPVIALQCLSPYQTHFSSYKQAYPAATNTPFSTLR